MTCPTAATAPRPSRCASRSRKGHRREADAEAGLDHLDRARDLCAKLSLLPRPDAYRGREGDRLDGPAARRLLRRLRIRGLPRRYLAAPAGRCTSRPTRNARRAPIAGSRCRPPARTRTRSPLRHPASSSSCRAEGAAAARTYKVGALLIEGTLGARDARRRQVAGGYLRITNTGSAARSPDRRIAGGRRRRSRCTRWP